MGHPIIRPDKATIAAIDATLRPCPHCGPMPAMPELVLSDTSCNWQVFCGPCGSSSGSSKNPQAAADLWNSRHEGCPEIGSSSVAGTAIALFLSNRLADLSPNPALPIYGFRTKDRQIAAYRIAREIIRVANHRLFEVSENERRKRPLAGKRQNTPNQDLEMTSASDLSFFSLGQKSDPL